MTYRHLPVVVPTHRYALQRLMELPADIKLIRQREKLGLTRLARSLGVTKQALWKWQRGDTLPDELLIYESIKRWAEILKNGAEPNEMQNTHQFSRASVITRLVPSKCTS